MLMHGFYVNCETRWSVMLLFSLNEETTDETKRERDGTRWVIKHRAGHCLLPQT